MNAFKTRNELAIRLGTTARNLRRLERLGIGPKPTYLGSRSARYAPDAEAAFAALKREAVAHA